MKDKEFTSTGGNCTTDFETWKSDPAFILNSEGTVLAELRPKWTKGIEKEEVELNATIMADSINIYKKTGITPSKMAREIEKLKKDRNLLYTQLYDMLTEINRDSIWDGEYLDKAHSLVQRIGLEIYKEKKS